MVVCLFIWSSTNRNNARCNAGHTVALIYGIVWTGKCWTVYVNLSERLESVFITCASAIYVNNYRNNYCYNNDNTNNTNLGSQLVEIKIPLTWIDLSAKKYSKFIGSNYWNKISHYECRLFTEKQTGYIATPSGSLDALNVVQSQ